MNSDFTPNWKLLGWKEEERFKKIFDYLYAHKENIIKLGFSEEVIFTLGKQQFILKGKNAGRKKDKRVDESKN